MKIDCGPTPEQRRAAHWVRLSNWHRWFAWRPVRLGAHDCRWLEVIERKGTYYAGYHGGWWEYQFRALN